MKRCCGCKQLKPHSEFHQSRKHSGYCPRCKPCAIAYAKAWYWQNKDRKRAYDAKRREEKRHLYRAASKRFRDRNPGAKNADTQRRRAILRGAMPPWADQAAIRAIYALAARKTAETGERWEVDHDIPLRNKRVCGLHVETNLRVVPQLVNLLKHNRFTLEGVR